MSRLWNLRLFKRRSRTLEAPPPKPLPTHELKDALMLILLSALAVIAVIQRLEWVVLASLVFIGAIVYKSRVRPVLDLGLSLLQRTRTARLGDVEFNVEQQLRDYSELLQQHSKWIQIILSDLTSEDIATLLSIHVAGGKDQAVAKDNLRHLRARGLVLHNAPTMEQSSEVWLTALGSDVAQRLLSDTGVTPKLS